MELADIINLILFKKHQFEIELPGKIMLRRPLGEVLAEYSSLQEYFRHVATLHHKQELKIHLISKNGTSIKRKGSFIVPISAIANSNEQQRGATTPLQTATKPLQNTVANRNDTVADSNDTVAIRNETQHQEPCPLHGTQNYYEQTPMSQNPEILEIKLHYATQRGDDYEQRYKELERRYNDLRDEKDKLFRENYTQKDMLELEFKKKEFELTSEKSQGLNGIMDKITTMPPEAWQLIAGLFPNHPMAKGISQGNNPPALEGIRRHPDKDANACMDMLTEVLLKQPEEIVTMIAMIDQALLNNLPALKKIYLQYYPEPLTNPQH